MVMMANRAGENWAPAPAIGAADSDHQNGKERDENGVEYVA